MRNFSYTSAVNTAILCRMKVAIVGQGYVGLTTAMGCLKAGHKVVGIEKNHKVIANLNEGVSHIEGISGENILSGIRTGSFRVTEEYSEVKDVNVVIIAVPTPLTSDGGPDLSILKSAVDSIAPHLTEDSLVISESTSYVGTLRDVVAKRITEVNPKVKHFAISPERVDPGNSKFKIENTPRLVGGIDTESTQLAVNFYSTFCTEVVTVSGPEVAEAAKLLENSFRYVNIGFINEFAKIMHSMGIQVSEVISAASTKPYGFMQFFPNIGIGGHCIPVDPFYLQKNAIEVGIPSRFIELTKINNLEMFDYSINCLERLYGSFKKKRILIVGVTYKPNISDTRESPAEHVIQILRSRGAKVDWHDPLVIEYMGETSSSPSGNYDLALVLVKHNDLNLSDWQGGPIYCIRRIDSNKDWIPILDTEINQ